MSVNTDGMMIIGTPDRTGPAGDFTDLKTSSRERAKPFNFGIPWGCDGNLLVRAELMLKKARQVVRKHRRKRAMRLRRLRGRR